MAQDTTIYKYDPKDVICLVGGFPVKVSGPLVVSRTNDVSTEQVAQDGNSICVNRNRNPIGTVTIPVMAQSLYDTAFTEMASQFKVTSFYLLEKSTSKLIATECWYKTQPDLSLGEEVELRAHVFTLADATMSLTNGTESLINQILALDLEI